MENALPAIPPKRYFTIGEVSELCGVKPYVLRYWEQEFTQLRPMKRRGNRRYYQHHEVLLIRRIRDLLYEQGFTISGARNRLSEAGAGVMAAGPRDADPDPDPDHDTNAAEADRLLADHDDVTDVLDGADANDAAASSELVAAALLASQIDATVAAAPVGDGHPVAAAAAALPPVRHIVPTARLNGAVASCALIKQELLLIRELLDTGGEQEFMGILSVSVGA
jgi:DNA-binding transcriptional MerR regulator